MKTTRKAFKETGFFSDLVVDYLDDSPKLQGLYTGRPTFESVANAANSREFDQAKREVLVSELNDQYCSSGLDVPDNVGRLSQSSTYTVTTGHQLNIFTGPLFTIYKILEVIRIADDLNKRNDGNHYVPVFWMATEDHDLAEIDHFMLFNDKVQWERESGGPVGRMSTEGLSSIVDRIEERLGDNEHEKRLVEVFRSAYSESKDLSEATRKLYHQLFSSRGLVIIDADSRSLKSLAGDVFKQEIRSGVGESKVSEVASTLDKHGYKEQVTPRDVNLFYVEDAKRIRIEKEGDQFNGVDSSMSWSMEELEQIIDEEPEKISPNVVFRPVYQEVILPNLAYIGGGGEIAYWLELKSLFDELDVPYPILFVRNSFILVDGGIQKKLDRLDLEVADLFRETEALVQDYVKRNSSEEIDLSDNKKEIAQAFSGVTDKVVEIDGSLKGKSEALLAKTMKELENLEKRMMKAAKDKEENNINQIYKIKERLFPDGGLQERTENLILWYMKTGEEFFEMIYEGIDPEADSVAILEL